MHSRRASPHASAPDEGGAEVALELHQVHVAVQVGAGGAVVLGLQPLARRWRRSARTANAENQGAQAAALVQLAIFLASLQ